MMRISIAVFIFVWTCSALAQQVSNPLGDYVRVYARRDGRWQLLSNRTVMRVNGPMAPAN